MSIDLIRIKNKFIFKWRRTYKRWEVYACIILSISFYSCRQRENVLPGNENHIDLTEVRLNAEKDSVRNILKAKSRILEEDIRKKEAKISTAKDMTKTKLKSQVSDERRYLEYLSKRDSIIGKAKGPDWMKLKIDIEKYYHEVDSMVSE